MLAAGVLSRRKEGIKIFYAIKHQEILAVVDLATDMVKREIAERHELLKAV
jgi:hypothetical protein